MKAVELRVACALLGWNIKKMAREIGMAHTTVWKWANGDSKMPGVAKLYIAKILEENGYSLADIEKMTVEPPSVESLNSDISN